LTTSLISRLRNCFRCGSDFSSREGRLCPECQISTTQRKRPLNPKLTFREQQVVELVSQAKLNKEIAYELHLSEGTVKEYLNRIFRKLGKTNRTEVALWALKNQMEQSTEELSQAVG